MHKRTLSALAVGSMLAAASSMVQLPTASAAPILAGDLVAIRLGDGTTAPNGSASKITLDEYAVTYTAGAPTGVALLQSIAAPTADDLPNSIHAIGQGGTAA